MLIRRRRDKTPRTPRWRNPFKPRYETQAQRRAEQVAHEREVKQQVRIRDGFRCRVCRRPMGSVHEIDPKGMGGSKTAVRLENSIAVCGDGVAGCHGLMQRGEVVVVPADGAGIDANGPLTFEVKTDAAMRWLALGQGDVHE